MNDRENVDENDVLRSLLSRHSYDVGCKRFSGGGDVVSVQQTDDDTETQNASDYMISKSRAMHTIDKPYTCDVCHVQFVERAHLGVHTRVHTGERPYVCDFCKKTFISSFHLARHVSTHSRAKTYRPDMCHMDFDDQSRFDTHTTFSGAGDAVSVQQIDDDTETQNTCQQMTSKSKATHTDGKRHRCIVCHKAFTHTCSLNAHMLTRMAERPYKSDMCHQRFNQPGHLQALQHTDTGPYVCDICTKVFASSYHLASHKLMHSGTRQYTSNLRHKQPNIDTQNTCEQTITSRKSKTIHKPQTFNECYMRFAQKLDLEVHKESQTVTDERPTHTNEKMHQCVICHEEFYEPYDLMIHKCIRKHIRNAGERRL